jgi:hypothetical protein
MRESHEVQTASGRCRRVSPIVLRGLAVRPSSRASLRIFAVACAWLAAFAAPSAVSATPATDGNWFTITQLLGGWNVADFGIQSSETTKFNPGSCALTDYYIVDSTEGGASLFASMLLTAYSQHQQVQIVVDGCEASRPRIVGVYVRPPQ